MHGATIKLGMMKFKVAFRNFANAPKNHLIVYKPFVYILYCLSNY